MKKMICAILALSLVFALAACGGSKPEETTAPVANIEGTMEELLNKVIEQRPVEFSGGVIPIDLTDTSEDGAWHEPVLAVRNAEKGKPAALPLWHGGSLCG